MSENNTKLFFAVPVYSIEVWVFLTQMFLSLRLRFIRSNLNQSLCYSKRKPIQIQIRMKSIRIQIKVVQIQMKPIQIQINYCLWSIVTNQDATHHFVTHRTFTTRQTLKSRTNIWHSCFINLTGSLPLNHLCVLTRCWRAYCWRSTCLHCVWRWTKSCKDYAYFITKMYYCWFCTLLISLVRRQTK